MRAAGDHWFPRQSPLSKGYVRFTMVIFIVIFALPWGEPMSPHMLTDAVNLLARSSPPGHRLDLAEVIIQCPSLRIISGSAVA
jgi:hypothetical protein